MRLHLKLRFDYGSSIPWVTKLEDNSGLSAIVGPNRVVLRTPVELRGANLATVAEFTVAVGECVPFVLTHGPSHLAVPAALDWQAALRETEDGWRRWRGQCCYHGPWKEAVQRSLLTLKALTDAATGGIIAAPTTSLPEQLGGARNWDYRYCWLRDATLTLMALMSAGYRDEALAWRDWLLRSASGSPEQIQIMYGVAGERQLNEWEVPWLPGYQGSAPVRIGNAASNQLQLDIYGELLDAFCQGRHDVLAPAPSGWALQERIEHLLQIWEQPDEGIWEVRGGRRQFTFSKVMAWVALDRTVRDAERFKLQAPVDRWLASDPIVERVLIPDMVFDLGEDGGGDALGREQCSQHQRGSAVGVGALRRLHCAGPGNLQMLARAKAANRRRAQTGDVALDARAQIGSGRRRGTQAGQLGARGVDLAANVVEVRGLGRVRRDELEPATYRQAIQPCPAILQQNLRLMRAIAQVLLLAEEGVKILLQLARIITGVLQPARQTAANVLDPRDDVAAGTGQTGDVALEDEQLGEDRRGEIGIIRHRAAPRCQRVVRSCTIAIRLLALVLEWRGSGCGSGGVGRRLLLPSRRDVGDVVIVGVLNGLTAE